MLFSLAPKYMGDAVLYLRDRDNYLETATCQVSSFSWGTITLFFGKEVVYCTNNNKFYIFYKPQFVRLCKEGETYRVRYLPNSKVIVSLQLIGASLEGGIPHVPS